MLCCVANSYIGALVAL